MSHDSTEPRSTLSLPVRQAAQPDFDPLDLPWAEHDPEDRSSRRGRRPRRTAALGALAVGLLGAAGWMLWPQSAEPSGVAGPGRANAESSSSGSSSSGPSGFGPSSSGHPSTTAEGAPKSTSATSKPTAPASTAPTSTAPATTAPATTTVPNPDGTTVAPLLGGTTDPKVGLFAGTNPDAAAADVAFAAWGLDGFEGADPVSGVPVGMEVDDPATPKSVTCRYAGPAEDLGAAPFLGTCVVMATSQPDLDATVSGWVISVAEGEEAGSISAGGFRLTMVAEDGSTAITVTPEDSA